jgi:MFS family permease
MPERPFFDRTNIMASAAFPIADSEFAGGWRAVAAGAVGMGTGVTMFSYLQSMFVTDMQEAFGWTRGEINLAMGVILIAALVAPLVGMAIDRIGVRPIVFFSTIATSAAFAALSAITADITSYYLAFGALILLGAGTTPITYTRAISSWFDKQLGIALAIALSGVSITALILPPILDQVIDTFGWRAGYGFLALLPLLLAMPTTWFWLHERARPRTPLSAAEQSSGLSATEALMDRRFWIMAVAISFVTVPAIALATQLQPLLTDKGFTATEAAWLLSVFATAVLLGRVGFGLLIDRFWAPGMACGTLLAASVGTKLLMGGTADFAIAATGLVLLGIAQGAELNLLAYLIARYFGLRAFATIFGYINVIFGFAIAAGAVVIGQLYDAYGNYDLALGLCGGCLLGSAILFPLMGRYPEPWEGQPAGS